MVDEADRLGTSQELFRIPAGERRMPKSKDIIEAFDAGWADHFGDPRVLRHDPEGCMDSDEFARCMGSRGVLLDNVPGEAHEQTKGVFA